MKQLGIKRSDLIRQSCHVRINIATIVWYPYCVLHGTDRIFLEAQVQENVNHVVHLIAGLAESNSNFRQNILKKLFSHRVSRFKDDNLRRRYHS